MVATAASSNEESSSRLEVSLCLNTSRSSLCQMSGMSGKVCRICQSETGIMVRPCGCAGTMATIHENCLNEWVSRSRAEKCEICKESYAQSSRRFRPLRQWTKPKITFRQCLIVLSLICLVSSLANLYFICVERKFFERVFVHSYPPRGGDTARIVIASILIIMIGCILSMLYDTVTGYFGRQRVVRFIDNPNLASK